MREGATYRICEKRVTNKRGKRLYKKRFAFKYKGGKGLLSIEKLYLYLIFLGQKVDMN